MIAGQRKLTMITAEKPTIDLENLQIWSWNVNGMRAVVKKNRIQEFFEKA